jgi:hypothetical protein
MTYSPPIIGTAQLLNIRASSWPGLGTLFIVVSVLMATWAVVRAFRRGEAGRGESGLEASAGAARSRAFFGHVAPGAAGSPAGTGPGVPLLMLALGAGSALGLGGCDRDGDRGRGTAPESSAAASALARAPVQPPASDADRMTFDGREDPYCNVPVEEIRWGGVIETTGRRDAGLRLRRLPGGTPPFRRHAGRRGPPCPGRGLRPGGEARGGRLGPLPPLPQPEGPGGSRGPALLAIETDRMAVNLQAAYAGRLMNWDQALRAMAEAWELPRPSGAPTPYTAPR